MSNFKDYLQIFKQLIKISISKNSPLFKQKAEEGYMRGTDFYKPTRFLSALVNAGVKCKSTHGKYPDLVDPTDFSEKLFYRKFFGKFEIPESGNKLLTYSFIPESVA